MQFQMQRLPDIICLNDTSNMNGKLAPQHSQQQFCLQGSTLVNQRAANWYEAYKFSLSDHDLCRIWLPCLNRKYT